jgi:hypothetical protein
VRGDGRRGAQPTKWEVQRELPIVERKSGGERGSHGCFCRRWLLGMDPVLEGACVLINLQGRRTSAMRRVL